MRTFVQPVRQVLITLCLSGPYFPDFLTPTEGTVGLEAGLDRVLSTGKGRLRREVGALGSRRARALQPVADGVSEAMQMLGQGLREYYGVAIAPHWNRMWASVLAGEVGVSVASASEQAGIL